MSLIQSLNIELLNVTKIYILFGLVNSQIWVWLKDFDGSLNSDLRFITLMLRRFNEIGTYFCKGNLISIYLLIASQILLPY
jgi:hypothetical protein